MPGPRDGLSLRGRDFEICGPTDFTYGQILAHDMIIHRLHLTVGMHTAVRPGVTIVYQVIESIVHGESLPVQLNFSANMVILPHVVSLDMFLSSRPRLILRHLLPVVLVTLRTRWRRRTRIFIKEERPPLAGSLWKDVPRRRFESKGDLETEASNVMWMKQFHFIYCTRQTFHLLSGKLLIR
jgi:hypothetical protein